jgi:hypothetical protein
MDLVTIFCCLRIETPLSSPPTTHVVTVEVFDPASTRETIKAQCQSYSTTNGQSASLSWNKGPIWGLRPDFYYCHSCWFVYVGRLQLLTVLASAFILGFQSHGTRDHILLSQIRDSSFCRLVRPAGLRWRYWTPPPHGIDLRYQT